MLEFSGTFGVALASVVILNVGCSAALAQTAAPRPLGPCEIFSLGSGSRPWFKPWMWNGNRAWRSMRSRTTGSWPPRTASTLPAGWDELPEVLY